MYFIQMVLYLIEHCFDNFSSYANSLTLLPSGLARYRACSATIDRNLKINITCRLTSKMLNFTANIKPFASCFNA